MISITKIVPVEVELTALLRQLSTDELRAIEKAVDDRACCVDFTLATIRRLSASLMKNDRLTAAEVAQAAGLTPAGAER